MKYLSLLTALFAPRKTLAERFAAALDWVQKHTSPGGGIAVSSANAKDYPEVSGYFIPSLLIWGERDLGLAYGRWLASIQNDDGSWSDPVGSAAYTFDTGQILKGLIALVGEYPEFMGPILRGCDWILSRVQPNGQITTPDKQYWQLPGGRVVPEAIHLYALQPLREAAHLWGIARYEEGVKRALSYYLADPGLTRFETLSHFHAYIIEALIDLGCPEVAATAMEGLVLLQRRDGALPGYRDSRWVCSTGLFQYAVIWYRLGERKYADKAFRFACLLQNNSGGFFGGYGRGADYFPSEEISWAVKYFLDALWWKINASFCSEVESFPTTITEMDGRYRLVASVVRQKSGCRILEAGCGKGRFLRCIQSEFSESSLTGLDISKSMLDHLPEGVTPLFGSLLNIPVADRAFDIVFCIEALEHAVNIPGAIKELCRVITPGGTLLIIDKNRERLGRLKIAEWEQWFDEEELTNILRQNGFTVCVEHNLPYDGRDGSDGLFLGWVATKK